MRCIFCFVWIEDTQTTITGGGVVSEYLQFRQCKKCISKNHDTFQQLQFLHQTCRQNGPFSWYLNWRNQKDHRLRWMFGSEYSLDFPCSFCFPSVFPLIKKLCQRSCQCPFKRPWKLGNPKSHWVTKQIRINRKDKNKIKLYKNRKDKKR